MANGILINQSVSLNEDSILEALSPDENAIDVVRISNTSQNDNFIYTRPSAFNPSSN